MLPIYEVLIASQELTIFSTVPKQHFTFFLVPNMEFVCVPWAVKIEGNVR